MEALEQKIKRIIKNNLSKPYWSNEVEDSTQEISQEIRDIGIDFADWIDSNGYYYLETKERQIELFNQFIEDRYKDK